MISSTKFSNTQHINKVADIKIGTKINFEKINNDWDAFMKHNLALMQEKKPVSSRKKIFIKKDINRVYDNSTKIIRKRSRSSNRGSRGRSRSRNRGSRGRSRSRNRSRDRRRSRNHNRSKTRSSRSRSNSRAFKNYARDTYKRKNNKLPIRSHNTYDSKGNLTGIKQCYTIHNASFGTCVYYMLNMCHRKKCKYCHFIGNDKFPIQWGLYRKNFLTTSVLSNVRFNIEAVRYEYLNGGKWRLIPKSKIDSIPKKGYGRLVM